MERRVLGTPVVRKKRSRGFTLVELAVVVTIVAVLAVIALVGYRKYMLNSHITEAQSVISAIKIAQEDHKSEKGTYQDVSGTSGTFCPVGAGVSNMKYGWDPTCNGGVALWNTLAVHVEGSVQFGYKTNAGTSSTPTPPTEASSWVTGIPTTAVPSWYFVVAQCDLDPSSAAKTTLVGSSLDNQIFTQNAGE